VTIKFGANLWAESWVCGPLTSQHDKTLYKAAVSENQESISCPNSPQFEAEYICTHASVQMPVVLLDDQPKIVFAVNLIIPMSYDHAAAVIQQRLVRFLCTSYLEDTDIYGQPFQLFCWVVVSRCL